MYARDALAADGLTVKFAAERLLMSATRILVVGATGGTGREVVARCAAACRKTVRHSRQARRARHPGIGRRGPRHRPTDVD
jgi:hypothetical protein